METVVYCVPNFSEGRNQATIEGIAEAVTKAGGRLLAVEPDADYNRTVIAFVGSIDGAVSAALAGIKKAAELIDMRTHTGGHPRIGAADVVPFTPTGSLAMDDCIKLAEQLGQRVGEELKLPVYLYGLVAKKDYRSDLAQIRKGGYEALPERIVTDRWRPDFGPARFVERFGAVCVGARPFLIAYNVNLSGGDLAAANLIAGRLRESGRMIGGRRVPGTLSCVKAIGVELADKGLFQVSMNLTDPAVTSMYAAYQEVRRLAVELDLDVAGSEVVGLVPLGSMIEAGRSLSGDIGGKQASLTEMELVEATVVGLGLSSIATFSPKRKILEYRIG